MKTMRTLLVVGLSLMGAVGSASAQYYGGRDYGDGEGRYRERGRDYRDDDRGRDFRDRDGRDRDRRFSFDERMYLRCNPDVLAAVRRGTMESGIVHYQTYGRRERRRLSC